MPLVLEARETIGARSDRRTVAAIRLRSLEALALAAPVFQRPIDTRSIGVVLASQEIRGLGSDGVKQGIVRVTGCTAELDKTNRVVNRSRRCGFDPSATSGKKCFVHFSSGALLARNVVKPIRRACRYDTLIERKMIADVDNAPFAVLIGDIAQEAI